MMYKLYKTQANLPEANAAISVGVEPTVCFVFDLDNTDYQAYLKWLDEGNTPLPAEDPATPASPASADEGVN